MAKQLPLLEGPETAYQFALTMRKELQVSLDYWSGQRNKGALIICELLRKWIAELEQKGAQLRQARLIVDLV